MKYISLLLFISIVNACATSSEVDSVDAKVEHRIYCSGSDNTWDTCYQKASELCGANEYDVLQKDEDKGAFAAYESARVLPDRRLIIQCKQ